MPLRKFIVVDLFCGAGGASQGTLRALDRMGLNKDSLRRRGYDLSIITVNHWSVAVETIKRNIAGASVYNASIENVDPVRVLNGDPLHLLICAPECISHSYAKGSTKINDQSRTTAAWVLDWVAMKPHAIYIENVPAFMDWAPMDDNGDPIRTRKGEHFEDFMQAIRNYGYRLDYGIFNCANYGDATTRTRFFASALRNDYQCAPRFPAPTHAQQPTPDSHLKPWIPASACIDFAEATNLITYRDDIHAPTTLRRIYNGFKKQTKAWDAPLYAAILDRLIPIAQWAQDQRPLRHTTKSLGRTLTSEEKTESNSLLAAVRDESRRRVEAAFDAPLATFTRSELPDELERSLSLVLGQQVGATARTTNLPLPTIATSGAIGIAQPVLAVITHGAHDDRSTALHAPLPTITAKNGLGIAQPFVAQLHSANTGSDGSDHVDEPLSTITAGGNHHAIAQPLVIQERDRSTASSIDNVDRQGLAQPFLTPNFGERERQQPRIHSIQEPLPTITSHGAGMLSVAFAFTTSNDKRMPYYVVDNTRIYINIGYRMLQPKELARAHSFDHVRFSGSTQDAIRQIGNSIPVNTAAAFTGALLEPIFDRLFARVNALAS